MVSDIIKIISFFAISFFSSFSFVFYAEMYFQQRQYYKLLAKGILLKNTFFTLPSQSFPII